MLQPSGTENLVDAIWAQLKGERFSSTMFFQELIRDKNLTFKIGSVQKCGERQKYSSMVVRSKGFHHLFFVCAKNKKIACKRFFANKRPYMSE